MGSVERPPKQKKPEENKFLKKSYKEVQQEEEKEFVQMLKGKYLNESPIPPSSERQPTEESKKNKEASPMGNF